MQHYTVYLYLETALHVSGCTTTHHQECRQLYLQHLVFVTPLLLPAAIVEESQYVNAHSYLPPMYEYICTIFQYISNKMLCYTVYLYLETALHVLGGTTTHHQECRQLYLQHLVFVTPLLLSAAIVEESQYVNAHSYLPLMYEYICTIFQYISNKMLCYTVYLYLETALRVSGGTSTHHQRRRQLYLQHLVFVKPLLAAGSSNGLTNTRCCRYICLHPWWWVKVPPEACRAVSR
jgi:hypothetical protein